MGVVSCKMGHEGIGVLVDELGMLVQLASHDGDVMISDDATYMLTMLEEELSLLASSLVDAKQRYPLRELGLARQIREVVYDVEDALESWSMQMQKAKAKANINMIFPGFLIRMHRSAVERISSIIYRSLSLAHRFIRSQLTTGNHPEVPSTDPFYFNNYFLTSFLFFLNFLLTSHFYPLLSTTIN